MKHGDRLLNKFIDGFVGAALNILFDQFLKFRPKANFHVDILTQAPPRTCGKYFRIDPIRRAHIGSGTCRSYSFSNCFRASASAFFCSPLIFGYSNFSRFNSFTNTCDTTSRVNHL